MRRGGRWTEQNKREEEEMCKERKGNEKEADEKRMQQRKGSVKKG